MPLRPLNLATLPMIQAAHFTSASRETVDLIVIHTMESAEKPGTARTVAEWFAGPQAPRASSHYCVDSEETIRCVRDEDVAWHAPGVNQRSIGIEHAGKAGQTAAEWNDNFSMAMLLRSIDLCELLCRKWNIPAALVEDDQLSTGEGRGITTHALVTKAFPNLGDHWDPGPNFPLMWYIGRVAARIPG